MFRPIFTFAWRCRLLSQRVLARLGFREDSFLLVIAVLIGIVTSAAAVGFHELITLLRDVLYQNIGPSLYHRWIWLLVIWPMLGGLVVGVLTQWIFKTREGQGVIDVIESVRRSSGFIRPQSAIEKILTSAVTIGSGGSGGAEAPIVQIGAAISSGFGSLFAVARQNMPVLVGCGAAAGISAIFNSPIGGLLFALEVILSDFSLRTITPVVVASVIANVTTQAIYRSLYRWTGHAQIYDSIFHIPPWLRETHADVYWPQLAAFAVLGIACGLMALSLTRTMFLSEKLFDKSRWPKTLRPALGGFILGLMGVAYIVIYQWAAPGQVKPIPFDHYAPPAFFGDGYGAVQLLLGPDFYISGGSWFLMISLFAWMVAKILATCVTLSSGGSGGVIAPALFIGATGGGLIGMALQATGFIAGVRPELYALLGMAGVLAATVHAPLASTLILMEITGDSTLILPGMLTAVLATSIARVILPDSIYTHVLRQRGVPGGTGTDLILLRRLSLEQVNLEPANLVSEGESLQRILAAMADGDHTHFVAINSTGNYAGMLCEADLHAALLEPDAIPLLLVRDVMRGDLAPVFTTDDLASVMDRFAATEAEYLPVAVQSNKNKIIGVVSRTSLMRRYRTAVIEET